MISEKASYGVLCNQIYAIVFFFNAGTNTIGVSQLYQCNGRPSKSDPCQSIFALITALSVLPDEAYLRGDAIQETESEANRGSPVDIICPGNALTDTANAAKEDSKVHPFSSFRIQTTSLTCYLQESDVLQPETITTTRCETDAIPVRTLILIPVFSLDSEATNCRQPILYWR